MSGAVHPGSDRVDQAMHRLGHWREGPVAEIPWDDLRAEVLEVDLAAYVAGQGDPAPAHTEALAAALDRVRRLETRVSDLLRVNGELAMFTLGTGSEGAAAMCRERRRQVDVEGYTAEHDAGIPPDQLIHAAVAYALAGLASRPGDAWLYWPWAQGAFKPTATPHRNLERAGALLMAAYDRLTPDPATVLVRPRSIGSIALPVRGEIG